MPVYLTVTCCNERESGEGETERQGLRVWILRLSFAVSERDDLNTEHDLKVGRSSRNHLIRPLQL